MVYGVLKVEGSGLSVLDEQTMRFSHIYEDHFRDFLAP